MRQFRHHLLDQGYARGTVVQREGDVARLAASYSLSEVTADELAIYLSPARTAWRPEYRKRVSTSLRIFYSWANARGLLDNNPALALAAVRVPRAIPRPVPELERAKACNSLSGRAGNSGQLTAMDRGSPQGPPGGEDTTTCSTHPNRSRPGHMPLLAELLCDDLHDLIGKRLVLVLGGIDSEYNKHFSSNEHKGPRCNHR
jgi:hypothetical protein